MSLDTALMSLEASIKKRNDDDARERAACLRAMRACHEYFADRYDGAEDGYCQGMVEPMELLANAFAVLGEKP